jgi:hypothetical protein
VFQRFGHLVEHACLALSLLAGLALEALRRRRNAHVGPRVVDAAWARPLRAAWLDARAESLPVLLRRSACVGVVLVGMSQPLGYVLGWSGLRSLGVVSGASPLPLVFNALNGYEYWAAQHKLELQLRDGAWSDLALDSHIFAELPGSHRLHMLLTFPFMAAPIVPQPLWEEMLERALCDSGPLARAAALPSEVRAGRIEIAAPGRSIWRGGFGCPP